MGHGRLDPILGSYSILGIDFQKILAQGSSQFSTGFELIHIAFPLFGSRKKVAESKLLRIRTAVTHPDFEVRI